MANILIVDDEKIALSTLSDMLAEKGHQRTLAENGGQARKYMQAEEYDIVLCDINMPGESGLELIQFIADRYPDTAVIMVTALDDPYIAETALKSGIYDYIAKPITLNRLVISVSNALRRRELEKANRQYSENLERMVAKRTAKLQEALDRIIQTIALTVEKRDPYTAGHQKRVADLAAVIAQELGLGAKRIEGLQMAGIIHDLGKISLPAELLSKPGCLSEAEFTLVKEHPQVGYDILKDIDFPWPIAEIVLQHHERCDGSGYPRNLHQKDILIEARILMVADVAEAIASHRPYRPGLGLQKALDEISKGKGQLYDSDVVKACLKIFRNNKFILNWDETMNA